MRARYIKPGFFKNEDLASCSVQARLLAPGLWMMADREGRMEYRPMRIKAEIFPYDAVEIEPLVEELVRAKHASTFYHGGKCFIQINNFLKHQRPHSNEVASAIPDKNEADGQNCDQGEQRLLPRQAALRSENGVRSKETLTESSTKTEKLPHAPSGIPIPSEDEIRAVLERMTKRHAKKANLGGTELERAVCEKLADSTNPHATLAAIEKRHLLGCEREWRGEPVKYWPNLVFWVRDNRYIDPDPPEDGNATVAPPSQPQPRRFDPQAEPSWEWHEENQRRCDEERKTLGELAALKAAHARATAERNRLRGIA